MDVKLKIFCGICGIEVPRGNSTCQCGYTPLQITTTLADGHHRHTSCWYDAQGNLVEVENKETWRAVEFRTKSCHLD